MQELRDMKRERTVWEWPSGRYVSSPTYTSHIAKRVLPNKWLFCVYGNNVQETSCELSFSIETETETKEWTQDIILYWQPSEHRRSLRMETEHSMQKNVMPFAALSAKNCKLTTTRNRRVKAIVNHSLRKQAWSNHENANQAKGQTVSLILALDESENRPKKWAKKHVLSIREDREGRKMR